MRKFFKSLLTLALVAVAIGVIYQLVLFGLRLNNALVLARDSAAFQMLQPQTELSILVVGDSTAVGTGAVLPSASVAGRMSQRYPCANLVNRGRDGALTRDLTAQIDGTGHTDFDLVLLLVGWQDVLRFTELAALGRDIAAALTRARERADHVVLLDTGNLGPAPIFVPPLNSIYDRRAREARQVFMEAAGAARAEYVDLFEEPVSAPFRNDPGQHYASDALHPNGNGYAVWYHALTSQSRIGSLLEC